VTFEAIAKEWFARQTFTGKTRTKAGWMINDLVTTPPDDRLLPAELYPVQYQNPTQKPRLCLTQKPRSCIS